MKKIRLNIQKFSNEPFLEFEDLPSTNTPINAENLNQIQSDIQDFVNQSISEAYEANNFYKSGDTFSIASDHTCFPGYITGSGTSLRFSIVLPKRIKNINSFTVNDLVLTVRVPSGGYLVASATDFLNHSNTSQVNVVVTGDYVISFNIIGTSAWVNGTNNTPVSVVSGSVSVTFN